MPSVTGWWMFGASTSETKLGVFNSEVMDPAIWQFRLFEHASLDYLGLHEHEHEDRVGGWESVADRAEVEAARD